jgi:DNA-binding transcriptional MerR regulator
MDGSDFLEYLELQDNLDLVTKSELLDEVRRRHARVTDRQLTSYITEGLIPRSARIGSRSGAFPKIVIDVLEFVANARERGLSVEAVKELLPLWRLLRRGVRDRRIDLVEMEYVARQHVRKPEAIYSVPWVLQWLLPCPVHHADHLQEIAFTFKDGSEHNSADTDPLMLGFLIERQDEEGECAKPINWMRVDLSPVQAQDPAAVILAIPVTPLADDESSGSTTVSQGSATMGSRSADHQLN